MSDPTADLPALKALAAFLSAHQAVMDLHKPVEATTTSDGGVRNVIVCDHCRKPTYPCPTVEAVTQALEGETHD